MDARQNSFCLDSRFIGSGAPLHKPFACRKFFRYNRKIVGFIYNDSNVVGYAVVLVFGVDRAVAHVLLYNGGSAVLSQHIFKRRLLHFMHAY